MNRLPSILQEYVILQSLFSGDADVTMYRLTGGSVSNNSVTITITLENENVVCVPHMVHNCYLSLTADAFTDVAGNSLFLYQMAG